MVEVYSGIYFGGDKEEFDEGSHYFTKGMSGGSSIRIPTGYTVRFFGNNDGSGTRSRVLYEGSYEDTGFYASVGGSKRMDVEKIDLVSDDFITVYDFKDTGAGLGILFVLKCLLAIGRSKGRGMKTNTQITR